MPLARISLTLSRHFSLSFIASGRSSGLHPVSSHSCCMYFLAGRPAFARPYVGVHRSTSLMSSSLLLQQCPACLIRLTWIVLWWEAGGRIVGALCGVAARACSILLATFLCNWHLASSPAVLLASKWCIYTTAAWKKLRYILSVRFDFHMINSLSIAVYAFVSCVSMSFSVDETLLPRWVNLSTSFRERDRETEKETDREYLMGQTKSAKVSPFLIIRMKLTKEG